ICCIMEANMPSEMKLILRETTTGREATPWLDPQREKFSKVARECHEAFKDSKLKGAAKVMAMNRFMSQRLREPEQP
ncbi:MAG TPA: hypothetical protein VMW64_08880, partial [Dehalococcoidia bacterium]|nr:hypothetical protein [Dehalococcoidia bacterium]